MDFSENRTVLFSTHVVEDLAASCSRLAVMQKGRFLYAGSMGELLEKVQGHVWLCKVADEKRARELEQQYHVSSKQLGEGGVQLKIISEEQPQISCIPCEGTLEDAYIYITGKKKS